MLRCLRIRNVRLSFGQGAEGRFRPLHSLFELHSRVKPLSVFNDLLIFLLRVSKLSGFAEPIRPREGVIHLDNLIYSDKVNKRIVEMDERIPPGGVRAP